jgi:NADPH:quinone reductase-like Zn-dependent oxidoreductase
VDVIIDVVGAPYWEQNLACLAQAGRLILLAMLGGGTLEINLGAIQRKRLRIIGSLLRPLPLEEKVALTAQFKEFALPLLAAGRLAPVIDSVYALDEVAAAHWRMEANANIGKIVLRVPTP